MSDKQPSPSPNPPEDTGNVRPDNGGEPSKARPERVTGNTTAVPSHTQQMQPNYPAPPSTGVYRQPLPPRKRKAPPRRRGGWFPPIWSILLMLIAVLGVAFGLVFLVSAMGGQMPTESPPQVVIVSVVPTDAPPPADDSILASPTFPPEVDSGNPNATGPLVMDGPTLAPVVFTSTPDTIAVGKTVIVTGVQEQQLNIRDNPGINAEILFRAPDGYTFTVVDGPIQTDGLTWWKVQDVSGTPTGWAATNYLEVLPQP